MIKIPDSQTKKWGVANSSDLFGNIYYTKNMNFDEEGYAKLSSRAVKLFSTTDADMPISFGRTGSGTFYETGGDDNRLIAISPVTISSAKDTGTGYPGSDLNSFGRWWQNKWYMTAATHLYNKTVSSGTWSAAVEPTALTSGVDHCLEVFRNFNTLCVADGNLIYQLNTSHTATTNLTIPAGFEVMGLAYNNNRMGIITRLASTVRSQNQDAMFFVWDGTTTAANIGVLIGSDNALSIVAYKNSWVILTRTGQLLYFNGSSFDVLANLPFYYRNLILGDNQNKILYGDSMIVEGDVIYINIANHINSFGKKRERHLAEFPSGVWCYDPKIGLYHRYSPSMSPVTLQTVAYSDINLTTNIFTSNATIPATGNPILYTSGDLTDIKLCNLYYIIKTDTAKFKLATTKANALAGTAIDMTSQGSGSHIFHAYEVIDYGQSHTSSSRVSGLTLFGDNYYDVYDHMIFGGHYYSNDITTTEHYGSCYTVPNLEGRGYFVTAKIPTSQVKDEVKKVYIKYRKLKDLDAIVVKYKNIDTVGLPVSCITGTAIGTFTATTTLTTTTDLSEAKTHFDSGKELEIEFLEGTGAGQMSKITALTESSGTYTITTEDAIVGAANNLKGTFLIDSWTTIKTITATDGDNSKGYSEMSIGKNSKWIQLKVELRGYQTTIEDLQIINSVQTPAV